MSVAEWDYYISYISPRQDPEKDGIIFRHRSSDPISEGQDYTLRGEWIRSTTLADIAFGHDHRNVMPVTEEKARQLMDQWVKSGRIPKAPDDWE